MKLIKRDYDKFTGITEEFWYEETEGDKPNRVTIRRLQDVEHTLAMNKIQHNMHSRADYSDSQGMHKVATIPLIKIEQWMREGFNWYESTDKERKAKLNERDNSKLLVRPGRL
jgi:hypothetical protein